MLKLDGKHFIQSMYGLENLMNFAGMAKKRPEDDWLKGMVKEDLSGLKNFHVLLDRLGLKMSAIAMRKLFDLADEDGVNFGTKGYYHGLEQASLQAHGRIVDEISLVHIFVVDSRNASFVEQGQDVFGQRVTHAFPDALYDLDEAASCLGMGRNTACVFHLMRAMEVSILLLCDQVGGTGINKHGKAMSWGVLVSNISGKVSLMAGVQKLKWEELLAHLNSARLAWRNETMHPGKKYTDEEARTILESVKGVMRVASSLMLD